MPNSDSYFISQYRIFSLFFKVVFMIKNPFTYFHIATFLLSGESRNLSKYWKAEVIMRDKFVLLRLIRNGMDVISA